MDNDKPQSPGLRQVIKFARQEAARLGSDSVCPEHLLLAIILKGDGLAFQTLESLGIIPDKLKAEIERRIKNVGFAHDLNNVSMSPKLPELKQKPSASSALDRAAELAGKMGHGWTGTEHLLLALFDQETTIAGQSLREFDMDYERTSIEVLNIIQGNSGRPADPVIRALGLSPQRALQIQISKTAEAADIPLPAYETEHAAGVDLRAANPENVRITVEPGSWAMVPTGLKVAIPAGYEGQVRPRSGLAAKHGIGLLNAPGTIDADYRGEIKVILFNFSAEPFSIKRGDRIAQLVINKIERLHWQVVNELPDTQRGEGGFGHTGR